MWCPNGPNHKNMILESQETSSQDGGACLTPQGFKNVARRAKDTDPIVNLLDETAQGVDLGTHGTLWELSRLVHAASLVQGKRSDGFRLRCSKGAVDGIGCRADDQRICVQLGGEK